MFIYIFIEILYLFNQNINILQEMSIIVLGFESGIIGLIHLNDEKSKILLKYDFSFVFF